MICNDLNTLISTESAAVRPFSVKDCCWLSVVFLCLLQLQCFAQSDGVEALRNSPPLASVDDFRAAEYTLFSIVDDHVNSKWDERSLLSAITLIRRMNGSKIQGCRDSAVLAAEQIVVARDKMDEIDAVFLVELLDIFSEMPVIWYQASVLRGKEEYADSAFSLLIGCAEGVKAKRLSLPKHSPEIRFLSVAGVTDEELEEVRRENKKAFLLGQQIQAVEEGKSALVAKFPTVASRLLLYVSSPEAKISEIRKCGAISAEIADQTVAEYEKNMVFFRAKAEKLSKSVP